MTRLAEEGSHYFTIITTPIVLLQMMRWLTISCLLLPIIIASASAQWSWGGGDKETKEVEQNPSELLEGETVQAEAQENNSESNSTVLDGIVDELISRKQGRSLGGFDDVYSNPTITAALDAGDDLEARNLIKQRLCTLGLMQVSIPTLVRAFKQ